MSKKLILIIKILLILFLSAIVLIILIFKILDSFINRYSEKIYSPNRGYYVEVNETNGGATTAYVSGVTIIDAQSHFSFSRYLSAWSYNSENVFGMKSSANFLQTKWLDSHTLKITYHCNEVLGKETKWRDIKILYDDQCAKDY